MKLWLYIKGNRKGRDAHQIEKEALKDPFLADALEGYDEMKGNHEKEVAKLQKEIIRLQKQITTQSVKKVNYRKTWIIAACITLILVIGSWVLLETVVNTTTDTAQLPNIQVETISKKQKNTTLLKKTQEVEIKSTTQNNSITDSISIANTDNNDRYSVDTILSSKKSLKEESKIPVPLIGEKAYNDYIVRNMIRPTDEECSKAKGPVVLVFKINSNGRPSKIRAIQGICSSSNREAIRLIATGPSWEKGSESDEATITITF